MGSNKKTTEYLEDKVIFSGNERKFIEFMNLIKNENYDFECSILL